MTQITPKRKGKVAVPKVSWTEMLVGQFAEELKQAKLEYEQTVAKSTKTEALHQKIKKSCCQLGRSRSRFRMAQGSILD